jgi:transposase
MHRFIDGEDRRQPALLPHSLEDYVGEENPVRVIEVFIDELDLAAMGFSGMTPAATGRPAYHPSTLLRIYLYGYLNRIQSSRRLEREAQRNIELMWLVGRLAPDFKTIADFRKDNGAAIRMVCSQFVVLCRQLGLFTRAVVAIDGSKFKAVNNRDKTIRWPRSPDGWNRLRPASRVTCGHWTGPTAKRAMSPRRSRSG